MKRGTRVRVHGDSRVHPKIRERQGIVQTEYPNRDGTVGIALEGEQWVWHVDPMILDVLPQEEAAQEEPVS